MTTKHSPAALAAARRIGATLNEPLLKGEDDDQLAEIASVEGFTVLTARGRILVLDRSMYLLSSEREAVGHCFKNERPARIRITELPRKRRRK